MTKKTRALSGASQDAYFRRVLKAQPSLAAAERDALVVRLRQDIAQVRLRKHMRAETAERPAASEQSTLDRAVTTDVAEPAPAFDPFTPNVIVVLRKSGRDAAVAALGGIASVDDLHLLAREQRLGVPADLATLVEVRSAIVDAAERRVANRIAAAS